MLEKLQLPDLATQDMVNQIARCYMLWMIVGFIPRPKDFNYSCLKETTLNAHMLEQLQLPDLATQDMALERVTVLRPHVIAQRDIKNIFLVGLPRGPRATRLFEHFCWIDTAMHVLKDFRDALDSMTEDHFNWEPYFDDLIESLPDYCHMGQGIWHVKVPFFCWDVVKKRDEVHPDHLHPPVHRQRKGGDAGRRARAIEKGREPVEIDKLVSEDDHATCDIGSISRNHTQEVTPGASGMTYQPINTEIVSYTMSQISRNTSLSSLDNVFGGYWPQHFENAPNFTSLPVLPMSIETPDIVNILEDSNIDI
ncbi:hypothetical protein H5410_047258 [Solanum commersonii]|uniref:Aminotransferase-like plant mobile domain-containing protein n=1 Tax=Solanum commersonii TaxID=4109 RepID=A0A9J5XIM0_SOLCO|nr:hypothetical protein H5410_047258 [Solanum commersonii]